MAEAILKALFSENEYTICYMLAVCLLFIGLHDLVTYKNGITVYSDSDYKYTRKQLFGFEATFEDIFKQNLSRFTCGEMSSQGDECDLNLKRLPIVASVAS